MRQLSFFLRVEIQVGSVDAKYPFVSTMRKLSEKNTPCSSWPTSCNCSTSSQILTPGSTCCSCRTIVCVKSWPVPHATVKSRAAEQSGSLVTNAAGDQLQSRVCTMRNESVEALSRQSSELRLATRGHQSDCLRWLHTDELHTYNERSNDKRANHTCKKDY